MSAYSHKRTFGPEGALKDQPQPQRFEAQEGKAAREQPTAPEIDFADFEQLALAPRL